MHTPGEHSLLPLPPGEGRGQGPAKATRANHLWHLSARLLLALLPLTSHAGLLAESTRIIYPAQHDAHSVLIANTNPWPVLVQTWVDHGEGDLERASVPFVVVPAIFRLEPAATQSLRILHTGEALPEHQESLFWLNLYEIPPGDAESTADTDPARLTVTLNTQLKLLYRPAGLNAPDVDALAAQLEFTLQQDGERWHLLAHNPTPWNASLSTLSINGAGGPLPADTPDLLLPPFSARRWPLHAGQPAPAVNVSFNLIDDAGFSHPYQRRLAG